MNFFDAHIKQAIVVIGEQESMKATLQLWQRSKEQDWECIENMDCVIGRGGLTKEKKEGDGKTPTGLYAIGTAFGTDPPPPCEWPYRLTGPHDYWIDDPHSPDYNRWVVYEGDPDSRWKSYERLTNPLYNRALVIRYNEDPVIAGKGSAIFFHRWAGPDQPSAGCVTVSEEQVLRVLCWLKPNRNPVFLIKEKTT
jgi:L,D-peptidoglycan transpeptidase YkuD (ErfK/YbiS/YcfS/YnhG family)